MRLTLRTLLAYLDDVLEPAQTKEIGQKIAESPMATSLAQRIREVMRRRRLSAEDLNETGLDANLVADYIDGALSPTEIADVERVCLGSDAHLAEVAACHQILTLVLGEPVEIVPQSRERMYGLAEDGSVAKLAVTSDGTSQPATATAAATPFTPPPTQSSAWKAPLAFLAPVVLLGLWLWLVVYDKSNTPSVANNDRTLAFDDDADRGEIAKVPVIPPRQDEPNVDETIASTQKPDVDLDPTPPPDMPDPNAVVVAPEKEPTAATPTVTEPDNTAPATVAEKSTTPPAPAPDTVPVAPAKALGQYKASEGVLLQYHEPRAGWYSTAYESRILENARLAVPEPYTAVIKLEGNSPLLQIIGGMSLKLLGNNDAAPIGLDLTQGRVLLDSSADGTTPIAIRADRRLWRIEFVEPDTRVGVEVTPLATVGFEASLPENHFLAHLIVVRGSVRVADDAGASTMLGAKQQLILHRPEGLSPGALTSTPKVPESVVVPLPTVAPADANAEAVKAPAHLPQPIALIPEWCVPEKMDRSATFRKYAEEFQSQFDETLPAYENMLPLIPDDRPQMAEYGVKCLALLEQTDGLVKALAYSEHEESRRAASSSLRVLMPRHPEQIESIRQQLAIAFPGETAERIERLLWGFTTDEARDLELSLALVDWLDDSHVAVRELTIGELERLTGQLNFGYRALLSTQQRRSAVNRWKNYVEDNGGLLPNVPKE